LFNPDLGSIARKVKNQTKQFLKAIIAYISLFLSEGPFPALNAQYNNPPKSMPPFISSIIQADAGIELSLSF